MWFCKAEKFPGLQTVALATFASRKAKNDIIQSLDMSPSTREFQVDIHFSIAIFSMLISDEFLPRELEIHSD